MATTRVLPSAHNHHQHNHYQHQTPAFYQDKIFVALENTDPAFDLKGRITGPNNAYLNHIQLTGAKCWLRGRGSGYMEPDSGREAFEALHIHLQHQSPSGLNQAKLLAENLVHTVQQQHFQWRESRTLPTAPMPNNCWQSPLHPPVSLPISSGVFSLPPPPTGLVPPFVMPFDPAISSPPTTTHLIITDHHGVTGAPTQQQVVIFSQEPPTQPLPTHKSYSSSASSSPPLLQETITTTTTTYYFPSSMPVSQAPNFPLPPSPVPVSYPLAMLPMPHPIQPPLPPRSNWWDRSNAAPVLYNPSPSCPPPIRPPGSASTFVAWSADFPHQQQHPRCSFSPADGPVTQNKPTGGEAVKRTPVNSVMVDASLDVAAKRLKADAKRESSSKPISKKDAVVTVKKAGALSSLAVAYNSNDSDG